MYAGNVGGESGKAADLSNQDETQTPFAEEENGQHEWAENLGEDSVGAVVLRSLMGAGEGEGRQEERADKLGIQAVGDGDIMGVNEAGGGEGEEVRVGIPTEMVRLSQMPSIQLMVDLNDADCRRRRRRQLSSLIQIQVEAEQRPELVVNSSTQSGEIVQSNSVVMREVLATMAVGGQLGINFMPNDMSILNEMIVREAQAYSQMLEREAGEQA